MQGYFIRLDDRTSCGGKVIEATTDTMMDGLPLARLGDTVTCGASGGLYRIEGGVSWGTTTTSRTPISWYLGQRKSSYEN